MLKETLSADNLEEQRIFLVLFEEEEWTIGCEAALLEAGVDVNPVASAEKRAGSFRQRVWYDAAERCIWWHFEDNAGLRFVLLLHPRDQFLHVIAAVLTAHDLLVAHNPVAAVKLLMSVAHVGIQTDDGLKRLTTTPSKA